MTVLKQWNPVSGSWEAIFVGKTGLMGPPGMNSGVFYNVKDFGAVGDGITNDTASCTAAITALQDAAATGPGAALVFPHGTYLIDKLAITASNVTVFGYGATLLSTQGPAGGVSIVAIVGDYIQVYGLTIDHVTRPSRTIYQKQASAHGLYIESSAGSHNVPRGSYCRVRDVKVLSAWFSGIATRYFRSMVVEGCLVRDVAATGLYITGSHDIVIHGNTVEYSGDDGIFSGTSTNTSIPENEHNYRVSISDNNIRYASAKGIGFGGVLGGTIHGNNIYMTNGDAIQCYEAGVYELSNASRVVVEGNTVIGGAQYLGWQNARDSNNAAINIAGGTSRAVVANNVLDNTYGDVIRVQGTTDLTKSGRVSITGNMVTGSEVGTGIKIGLDSHPDHFNAYNVTVANNQISDVWANGIYVTSCSFVQVNGNFIRTWGKATSGTWRSVMIYQSDHTFVSDNMCVNDAVSGSTKQGITSGGGSIDWRPFNNWVGTAPGYPETMYGYEIGGKRIQSATAAPTTGAWVVGDRVMNANPTLVGSGSSQYVVEGWMCTTAGTPGTWTPVVMYANSVPTVPLYLNQEYPPPRDASLIAGTTWRIPSMNHEARWNGVAWLPVYPTVAADNLCLLITDFSQWYDAQQWVDSGSPSTLSNLGALGISGHALTHTAVTAGTDGLGEKYLAYDGVTSMSNLSTSATWASTTAESFTLIAIAKTTAAHVNEQIYGNRSSLTVATAAGCNLYLSATGAYSFRIGDAIQAPVISQPAATAGSTVDLVMGRRDVGTDSIQIGVNGLIAASGTDTTTQNIGSAFPTRIGRLSGGTTPPYVPMNGYVFGYTKRAITDAEFTLLGNWRTARLLT